jgi:hypothetical protein
MRLKNHRLGYFLASSVIALSCGGTASAAPVQGKASVRLTNVFATLQTGQPDKNPEHIAACRKQVSAPDSRYLGVTVNSQYSIDAQTMIMTASSSLPSPVATKPLQLTVKLAPLGIAGQYAFGAFRPPVLPNNYVLFSVGLDFKGAKSSVLVLNEGKDYNCLVSSDSTPFSGGVSEKLGVDQK